MTLYLLWASHPKYFLMLPELLALYFARSDAAALSYMRTGFYDSLFFRKQELLLQSLNRLSLYLTARIYHQYLN